MKATARAHTNIALIKYWGKKNQHFILPYNSSLSMTLDAFYTDTTVEFSSDFTTNQFYLNGELVKDEMAERVFNHIHKIKTLLNQSDMPHFTVTSTNHVPTAAGLASSSSGFAALTAATVKAMGIDLSKSELSRLARLGSGSATRSLFGGFAMWSTGNDLTSVGSAIDEHPEMDLHLLAIETNGARKKIPSRSGMQNTVETSAYYDAWVEKAKNDLDLMTYAIKQNDFELLGKVAENNAMAMHATNLAAVPSFTYFEPDTLVAVQTVQELRDNGVSCYYTLDAGPNLKILTQSKNIDAIKAYFTKKLPKATIIQATFGPGIQYLS
ncbi:diphosphomevalonate decarboxylase [Holzapfeliella sp. JNUCC 80]